MLNFIRITSVSMERERERERESIAWRQFAVLTVGTTSPNTQLQSAVYKFGFHVFELAVVVKKKVLKKIQQTKMS